MISKPTPTEDAKRANEPSPEQSVTTSDTYATDVLRLASGTTLAQLLAILAAPILTRIYSPGAYGLLDLIVSLTNILILLAGLRYELTIVLPKEDKEAVNLLGLSLLLVVLVSALTTVMVYFGGTSISRWLDTPALQPYLWILPPAVLFGGTFQAVTNWNTRTKNFGKLAKSKVVRSFGSIGTQLGLGTSGRVGGGSLIIATLFGQAVATIVLSIQTWQDAAAQFRAHISWSGMLQNVRRYKEFALFGTWAALLNSLSWRLPTFMLAIFFSTTVVGYYGLGTRMMRIPMDLIGQSIAQVFYQRASTALHEGTLAQVTEDTYKYLVKLSMFPLLVLSLTGAPLFVVFFGMEWAEAGVYTQILAIWTSIWFISSPISRLYSVLERQGFSLWINLIIFVTRLVALAIGGFYGSVRLALILFAASGILVYGYLSVAIMRDAGVTLSSMIQPVIVQVCLFAPIGLLLLYIKYAQLSVGVTVATAIFAVAAYYGYLLFTEPQVKGLLRRDGVMPHA